MAKPPRLRISSSPSVASPRLRHTSFSLSSIVARRSSVEGGGGSDPELLYHMASIASKLYR
ncbi:hypothetical protein F2Q70_00015989 [Brassica cretica]|uniref:Uncharacterized protein n=1 Tax=Brassica cretica TaxID=69181 RepID=A0A8S9I1J0_BRACR|nr:hypothetical protein F2Q68_00020518 [Brassica cretica]KAF2562308.1 hypothetical protein F2Q70_00015989 [Brassica cretica]